MNQWWRPDIRQMSSELPWDVEFDTQIYVSCAASDRQPAATRLLACVSEIESWMSSNRLKLNALKTEFIWIGTQRPLSKVEEEALMVWGQSITPMVKVRDLGVFIDFELFWTLLRDSSLIRESSATSPLSSVMYPLAPCTAPNQLQNRHTGSGLYSRHRPGLFWWHLCSGDCSPWTNQPAFSDAWRSCDPLNTDRIGRTEFPYIRTDSVELAPWFAQASCYKPRNIFGKNWKHTCLGKHMHLPLRTIEEWIYFKQLKIQGSFEDCEARQHSGKMILRMWSRFINHSSKLLWVLTNCLLAAYQILGLYYNVVKFVHNQHNLNLFKSSIINMLALTKELEQCRETWHASGKNLGKNLWWDCVKNLCQLRFLSSIVAGILVSRILPKSSQDLTKSLTKKMNLEQSWQDLNKILLKYFRKVLDINLGNILGKILARIWTKNSCNLIAVLDVNFKKYCQDLDKISCQDSLQEFLPRSWQKSSHAFLLRSYQSDRPTVKILPKIFIHSFIYNLHFGIKPAKIKINKKVKNKYTAIIH